MLFIICLMNLFLLIFGVRFTASCNYCCFLHYCLICLDVLLIHVFYATKSQFINFYYLTVYSIFKFPMIIFYKLINFNIIYSINIPIVFFTSYVIFNEIVIIFFIFMIMYFIIVGFIVIVNLIEILNHYFIVICYVIVGLISLFMCSLILVCFIISRRFNRLMYESIYSQACQLKTSFPDQDQSQNLPK